MTQRIIYTCPFVPAEWIAAHGFQPSRILPHASAGEPKLGMRSGICSYARAFANAALSEENAAAIIVTTLCDQMRRVSELLEQNTTRPLFLMNVPHTSETPNAQKLYASELQRLGRFLIRLGGKTPSNDLLADVISEYNAERSIITKMRTTLSARAYSELIAHFNRHATIPPQTPAKTSGVPIGLIGGPLLKEHFDIFDMIEKAGGYISLDGTETGERTMPEQFDHRAMKEDPFSALTNAYFNIPDAARRPNTALYQWLKTKVDERRLKGIILIRHLWCDTWHAESQRIKEFLSIPLLDLDITEDATDMNRKLTRVEAFMEMLK